LHALVLEIADDDVPDDIFVVHHENARPLSIPQMVNRVSGGGRGGHEGAQPREWSRPRARGELKSSLQLIPASISPFVRFFEAIIAELKSTVGLMLVASPRCRRPEVPMATRLA
jgi:hypothetical protein